MNEFSIFNGPSYAGWYQIGDAYCVRFMLEKRPSWFHRTMVRLVLGWVWVDQR